jgi:hypothetical protein
MCRLVCPVLHVYIRMSLVIGSIPAPLTWHGLWLRLIEDTTTARGALASALATRTSKGTRTCGTPTPQAARKVTGEDARREQKVAVLAQIGSRQSCVCDVILYRTVFLHSPVQLCGR